MMFRKLGWSLMLAGLLVIAILPDKFDRVFDVSQNRLNSLSSHTKQLLDHYTSPLTIAVYSPDLELLDHAKDLLTQYEQYAHNLKVDYFNHPLDSAQAKEYKVISANNLVFTYENGTKALDIRHDNLNERELTRFLQVTMNTSEQWLAFLSGHEEIDPFDTTDMGLSKLTGLFKQQGFKVAQLNLLQQQQIPKNTKLIIVANPQHAFVPLEMQLLQDYLATGGAMLWFTEPYSEVTAPLRTLFNLELAAGVVIDPNSMQLGSPHPAIKIITKLPQHAITQDIKAPLLMPWSGHLYAQQSTWNIDDLITTEQNTWTYTQLENNLHNMLTEKAILGPLTIGVTASKTVAEQEQRNIIVADSSFILNKYLPMHGNAKLITNMFAWLQPHNDYFIDSPTPLKDLYYYPKQSDLWVYKYGFTLIVPFILAFIGRRVRA